MDGFAGINCYVLGEAGPCDQYAGARSDDNNRYYFIFYSINNMSEKINKGNISKTNKKRPNKVKVSKGGGGSGHTDHDSHDHEASPFLE
jgi:hypothetical protein